ncbi:MAG: hypothetical protein KGL63_01155 [Betaproteobacteria bacterium]|nr:hypothetical protein [Betaproteobacteria bacterium]
MKNPNLTVRRAGPSDYAAIERLAAKYYRGNLSPEEQKEGFLSAQLSLGQIAAMGDDLGIVVAMDQEKAVAFACASRSDFQDQPPIVRHMLGELARFQFMAQPMVIKDVFVYGPVCIDAAYRGLGLLRKMYEQMKEQVSIYPLGIAFVADDNPASMGAHIHGLGMQAVGRFDYLGKDFQALAFGTRPGESC